VGIRIRSSAVGHDAATVEAAAAGRRGDATKRGDRGIGDGGHAPSDPTLTVPSDTPS